MCTTIGGAAHAGGSLSSALDQVFSILCQALNILLRNNLGGVDRSALKTGKSIKPSNRHDCAVNQCAMLKGKEVAATVTFCPWLKTGCRLIIEQNIS